MQKAKGIVLLSTLVTGGCAVTDEQPVGVVPVGKECHDSAACVSGAVCNDGRCAQLCYQAEDCVRGEGCRNGLCGDCEDDEQCLRGYRCYRPLKVCYSFCDSDSDCWKDYYCNAEGFCRPRREVGSSCLADEECLWGYCRDGYCCDSACDNDCMACNIDGLEGFCSARSQGSLAGSCAGQAAACVSDENCLLTLQCDGHGGCEAAGIGTCCGAYSCYEQAGRAGCYESCQMASQCAPGFDCLQGRCIKLYEIGDECADNWQCRSSYCVDGYCCDSGCNAKGYSCAVSGYEGQCRAEKQ